MNESFDKAGGDDDDDEKEFHSREKTTSSIFFLLVVLLLLLLMHCLSSLLAEEVFSFIKVNDTHIESLVPTRNDDQMSRLRVGKAREYPLLRLPSVLA